jgi:integrase
MQQTVARLSTGAAWVDLDLVFERGDGSPLRSDSLSKAFAREMKRVELHGVRFHDLRHAFATTLLEANVHPKVVSETLGHSSVSFTMDVYQHVIPTMQEQTAVAVQAAFG